MNSLVPTQSCQIDFDRLWGACRMESSDCEGFGVEAITDMLRVPFPSTAKSMRYGALEAWIAKDQALLIERQGDVIIRIWRVGIAPSGLGEPSIMVPFDADLSQARGDVFSDVGDAALSAAASQHGRAILATLDAFRSRAFVLRAAGDSDAGVALYQIFTLSSGRQHRPKQARGLAHWQGNDLNLFVDQPWPHGDIVRLVE